MYFPTFYTVKSLVERQPHPLEHAYDKWRNEIWDSCKALWTLWVPAQVINFAFVPRYLRVPFGMTLLHLVLLLLLCSCCASCPLCLCLVVGAKPSMECVSQHWICAKQSVINISRSPGHICSFPLAVPFLLPSLRVFYLLLHTTAGMWRDKAPS